MYSSLSNVSLLIQICMFRTKRKKIIKCDLLFYAMRVSFHLLIKISDSEYVDLVKCVLLLYEYDTCLIIFININKFLKVAKKILNFLHFFAFAIDKNEYLKLHSFAHSSAYKKYMLSLQGHLLIKIFRFQNFQTSTII